MDVIKDLSADNLVIFLAFFVPGFVAIKVYDLLIAGGRRDFSKGVFEVFAYSSLHYAVFFPLIERVVQSSLARNHPDAYWFAMVALIAVLPIGWPILFFRLSHIPALQRNTRDPVPTPWDRAFLNFQQGKRPIGVILHMKDGRRIGGVFGKASRASSYPDPDQIYLEVAYPLTAEGKFGRVPVKNSRGILVSGTETTALEFFEG